MTVLVQTESTALVPSYSTFSMIMEVNEREGGGYGCRRVCSRPALAKPVNGPTCLKMEAAAC